MKMPILPRFSATLPVLVMSQLALTSTEVPTPEKVHEIASRVADWQIETFETQGQFRALPQNRLPWHTRDKHHDLDWTNGALYAGMYQWSRVSGSSKYTEWLKSIGNRNDWKLHKRPYHADDHTVGQFYLNLYRDGGDSAMLEPTRQQFDWILANPKTGTLDWNAEPTDAHDRWGWCDALFMAPPVWARLARITNSDKYLVFMDQEYHATYDLLWDREEHLFWRDSSFFENREKNGRKLFWSRGNGWVFGGLAMMIPDLPEDWRGTQFYIDLYRKMANKLKKIQRSDGTWSMGLLGDANDYPNLETSGTAFFTFGLAWGIRNQLIDAEAFTPVVMKAWNALAACVREDGLLGWVQPIGAAPGESFENYSEVYGVGAFLAASSEILLLLEEQAVPISKEQ
jgi:rhamnogalacturonyl hydrolase YesR